MVSVIAPAFSLSASGLLGKALFYYDTKYGARVRTPKRTFKPPGNVWEVNKAFFILASERAKSLTSWQKKAWERAYPGICDSWRDIFMGKQIEFWNLSPLNNLTWPPISPQDVGPITFNHGLEYVGSIYWTVDTVDDRKMRKWGVNWLWWRVLNNARQPVESDLVSQSSYPGYEFSFVAGSTNYLWAGMRYLNGTWKAVFLDSYVK